MRPKASYSEFFTKTRCFFVPIRKNKIGMGRSVKKKRKAPTNGFHKAMNRDLVLFCGDRKSWGPSEIVGTGSRTHRMQVSRRQGEARPPLWPLPKHLTVPMACAEAARGLLVTRASSPKYWPREQRAISTAPFSSTSDLPWQRKEECKPWLSSWNLR